MSVRFRCGLSASGVPQTRCLSGTPVSRRVCASRPEIPLFWLEQAIARALVPRFQPVEHRQMVLRYGLGADS